jgi:hypothetical protein
LSELYVEYGKPTKVSLYVAHRDVFSNTDQAVQFLPARGVLFAWKTQLTRDGDGPPDNTPSTICSSSEKIGSEKLSSHFAEQSPSRLD